MAVEGRLRRRDRGISHQAAGRVAHGHQGAEGDVAARRVVRGGAFGRIRHPGRDCDAPRQEAIASFAGAPSSLAEALECLAVFALSLHHLQPALAARVFAEGTRAANKLLIIDLHVWRRLWGAMACTLARFTARRTTRHRTSVWAGSWSSALQVCDLLLLATLPRMRSTAHMKPW
jgi:hypothetical protein